MPEKYIEAYLSQARRYFLAATKFPDKEDKREAIANGYQCGIRSQAFEVVWNSVMMGMVNFLLKNKVGDERIAHGSLDYLAFLLSPDAFAKQFNVHAEHFNSSFNKSEAT